MRTEAEIRWEIARLEEERDHHHKNPRGQESRNNAAFCGAKIFGLRWALGEVSGKGLWGH